MSNESLDESIQDHFQAQQTQSPTDFASLWQPAQLQAQTQGPTKIKPFYRQPQWRPVAVAAGVLLVVTIAFSAMSVKNEMPARVADAERDALFNELIATTRWRAPSDVFLNMPGAIQVWDTPQFDWLEVIGSEES